MDIPVLSEENIEKLSHLLDEWKLKFMLPQFIGELLRGSSGAIVYMCVLVQVPWGYLIIVKVRILKIKCIV